MKDFEENNCRQCKKVFCCKTCREKHETREHDIFPGCEICISGTAMLSSTPDHVITHIKNCHWPLNCIYCKRLFGSMDEIFQHIKCPLANKLTENIEKSPYNSDQSVVQKQADTPPYYQEKNFFANKNLQIVSNLATSTPMQPEQGNNLLEKIQEVIVTPVDCSESKEDNPALSSCAILKRKVTFCDTPITDNFSKKSENMTSSANGGSAYYTANEQSNGTPMTRNLPIVPCIKITSSKITEESEKNNSPEKSVNKIQTEEQTVWISAVNISAKEVTRNLYEESPLSDVYTTNNLFVTPMVPKRKINVVSPSVTRQEETSIKLEGPIQISSTPNNSIIPVKSVPTIRDIFRHTEPLPCTSKSTLENWGPNENYDGSLPDNSIDRSIPQKLWTSMSKIMRNVLQGFSTSVDNVSSINNFRALKRQSSDDALESPMVKRFKAADIKCRENIRPMTPINKFMGSYRSGRSREFHINIVNSLTRSTTKTFEDKSTQTDPELFIDDQIL